MDEDLNGMGREALVEEVKKLRAGIREHRDNSAHDLCWHHPQLWALLPEKIDPKIAVPPWPKFMRGCIRYRQSLDTQAPDAPIADNEYDESVDKQNKAVSPVRGKPRGRASSAKA
jgi:hypothetical protein